MTTIFHNCVLINSAEFGIEALVTTVHLAYNCDILQKFSFTLTSSMLSFDLTIAKLVKL